ncbi:MAG: hypothetical protein J0H92_21235 [Sphingobacteriales bacterium]|jgi:hypothetical protein|nr:hypothetical protein [Sphingobacteriales bacterium]
MKTRKIKIKVNGRDDMAILNFSDNEIVIEVGNRKISRTGEYPFFILKEIRKVLEQENIFLMVNGSRIDVYPSGLSLPGFNAYIHVLGKPTSLDHLVDIFEKTDQASLIGTVEEQVEYHAKWVEALKSK